jgi:hypothetical protein
MEWGLLTVILVMIALRGNGGCLGAMIVAALIGGGMFVLTH